MSIILTISIFPDQSDKLKGFTQFWLRYIHGFSPHFHCQKSLRGVNDPRFTKDMIIGKSFELLEPSNYQYIYLCGVTARQFPGLHLALLPDEISSTYAKTYNGLEIIVAGAKELDIPYLPDEFAGMSRKHTTCRNWQFGVQNYGLTNLRRELVKE